MHDVIAESLSLYFTSLLLRLFEFSQLIFGGFEFPMRFRDEVIGQIDGVGLGGHDVGG